MKSIVSESLQKFKKHSDPVVDLNIGKVNIKLLDSNTVYEISIKTLNMLKEYDRLSRLQTKALEKYNGDFTKWVNDRQVKRRHYEIEKLGKKLIKCGLHKYFLRDLWEIVS